MRAPLALILLTTGCYTVNSHPFAPERPEREPGWTAVRGLTAYLVHGSLDDASQELARGDPILVGVIKAPGKTRHAAPHDRSPRNYSLRAAQGRMEVA